MGYDCLAKPKHNRYKNTDNIYIYIVDITGNNISIRRLFHDDVIKWKRFPRYWPFVREIHRSRVNSPHKSQRRGALMFSLICA